MCSWEQKTSRPCELTFQQGRRAVNKQTPHTSNVCGVFRRGECGEKGEWNPGGMGTAGVSVCVCVCVCVFVGMLQF